VKNPVTPPGIDPGTVRLAAQRLNHYATPGHSNSTAELQIFGLNEKASHPDMHEIRITEFFFNDRLHLAASVV